MREIKFRAWDKKRMVIHTNIQNQYDGLSSTGCSDNDADYQATFGEYLNKDRYIVMQYTSLKDKNGKEIYEGDILCVSDMEFSHFEDSGIPDSPSEIFLDIKGEVSFSDGQFEVGGHSLGEIPLSAIKEMDMRIIGNIYKNPELLK